MKHLTLIAMIIVILAMISCSGGESPMAPTQGNVKAGNVTGHQSWGLWQFMADPVTGTLEAVQLHSGQGHLNVIVFLEPPALVNLTLDHVEFNGDEIIADIGLRHPFLGLDEFTGFDVSGIFISNGSLTGFTDTAIRFAGPGDTYLMNPDGHSRYWNPTEFPFNPTAPIDGYKDGLLGTPDSNAHYNSTINGYKYYTEGLTAQQEIDVVNPTSRGYFSAGQKNVRRYHLKLGAEALTFNYAIDACWTPPTTQPPGIQVPDDFPPEANRSEPWRITVTEIENSLWFDPASGNGGGDLVLEYHVWDWYGIENDTLLVEAPAIGLPQLITTPDSIDMGLGYAVFTASFIDSVLDNSEGVTVLCSARTDSIGFQGHIPGTEDATYLFHTAVVGTNQPPVALAVATSPTGIQIDGTVDFDATSSYDPDGAIVDYLWDFDEDGTYGDSHSGLPETPTATFPNSGTFNVDLKVVDNLGLEDTLDETIEVVVSGFTGCSAPADGYGYMDDAFTSNDGKECTMISDGYYVTMDDNYGFGGCYLDLRQAYYNVNSAEYTCGTQYVENDDNLCIGTTDDWHLLPNPSVVLLMDSWLAGTPTVMSDDLIAYTLDIGASQVVILNNLSTTGASQLDSISVGYTIDCFDFAQNGDLWVLDTNGTMRHYVRASSFNEAPGDSFSLPATVLGSIFDFAIYWTNDHFAVFTDNTTGGTIYHLSTAGSLLGSVTNALRIGLENSGAGHGNTGDIAIDHNLLTGETEDEEACRLLVGGGIGGSTNYSMLARYDFELVFLSAFETNSSDHNGIGYITFDPRNHRLWTGGATYAPSVEAWANSWRPIPNDW